MDVTCHTKLKKEASIWQVAVREEMASARARARGIRNGPHYIRTRNLDEDNSYWGQTQASNANRGVQSGALRGLPTQSMRSRNITFSEGIPYYSTPNDTVKSMIQKSNTPILHYYY